MGRVYYHNPKREVLNESDVVDFMETYIKGDKLFWTESGDATLNVVDKNMLNELLNQWQKYYKDED